VVCEGNAAPCWWDGSPAHLPDGIDATLTDALARLDDGRPANTLCSLAAVVTPAARGTGLSRMILEAMRQLTRSHGFGHLIAPVRPSLKERYPLAPIERYSKWRRPDGWLFDPWMRTHERLGAVVGPPLPYSLRITGSGGRLGAVDGHGVPRLGSLRHPRRARPAPRRPRHRNRALLGAQHLDDQRPVIGRS
jgi:GNAT superfamily N-acetyltransferase